MATFAAWVTGLLALMTGLSLPVGWPGRLVSGGRIAAPPPRPSGPG